MKNVVFSQAYFLDLDSDIKKLLAALLENETATSKVLNFHTGLNQFCRGKGPCSLYITFNFITKTELPDLHKGIIKLHNIHLS